MNSLVEFWRSYSLAGPPYIHPEDKAALGQGLQGAYFDGSIDTFDSFVAGSRFGKFSDNRFFTALVPAPYMGQLDKADIVILMLNPGFEYVDYFAEYRMPGIKEMRHKTFRQELDDFKFPFCWLNPEYCWHSGFMYWERKLRKVISEIANRHYCDRYLDALEGLSRRLATLQLVPYHSAKFEAGKIIEKLPSVREMKKYAKDTLEPAARRGEKTLIVMRQRQAWSLNDQKPNIVVYDSNLALGARLEPTTRGGEAILNRFDRPQPFESACS
ncbi:MAG TPA: hypothetical protein VHY10_11790 [Xanthobacteraceae bacterium]|nr:hypothetical protein [Xanthobacteraceae bacterium]